MTTIEAAAREFAAKGFKIADAISWKVELSFTAEAAFPALKQAAPDLEYRPHQLADAITAAAVQSFGDRSKIGTGGVVPRDGGDIAVYTRTVSLNEFRRFLRSFGEEYLKSHLGIAA